jgi:hypothetical protein
MKDENKMFMLESKQSGRPLLRKYFVRRYPNIVDEIDNHDKKYNLNAPIFSQLVYNWIYDIKEHPTCPKTKKRVKFKVSKFAYEKYSGKGMRGEETQKRITKKRLETVDYKKIYGEKKKIPPRQVSFKEAKKIVESLGGIKNFNGFEVKFLSRVPDVYNYIKSDQFLPDCDQFQEKIYRIVNDMELPPLCEKFGKKLNFKGITKGYSRYSEDYRFNRKQDRLEKIENANVYELDKTVEEINKQIDYLKSQNLNINNLYQSFTRIDPNLTKSILFHTEMYKDIKFSNRVFLLIHGEPTKEKDYIRPVFFSLEKGYDMRFDTNNGTSKAERELMEWLGGYINDLEKNRNILDGKEIDIYSDSHKVGIEYDGIYWHNYDIVGDKAMFIKRQAAYARGVKILHIFETEWIQKPDIVKSLILSKFGIFDRRIYARKCVIKEIDSRTCIDFLNDNHLQGKDNSKYKFGLFYDDELVSVMTFGKRRISKSNDMELIRFCNKKNISVIGGASKLFKHFIRTHNPDKVISYANARISDGNLYHKMGFTMTHHASPNYWYFKSQTPNKLQLKHRSGYQKHRLSGILENFDPNKTEWENMKAHGYYKIYDCGNLVFEYKNNIT